MAVEAQAFQMSGMLLNEEDRLSADRLFYR